MIFLILKLFLKLKYEIIVVATMRPNEATEKIITNVDKNYIFEWLKS